MCYIDNKGKLSKILMCSLTPESDYETWSTILVSCIQPKGEYYHLIPDLIKLIQQFSQNGFLLEPLKEYSERFVSPFLVDVVNQILNLKKIDGKELEYVFNLLLSIPSMIKWAILSNKFLLTKDLGSIYFPTSSFYQNNFSLKPVKKKNQHGHSELWRQIIEKSKDQVIVEVAKRCEAIDGVPLIQHFDCVLTFGLHFSLSMGTNFCIDILLGVISTFYRFLRSSSLKDFEYESLASSLKSVFLLLKVFDSKAAELISEYLKIIEEVIQNDSLTLQIMGAENLVSVYNCQSEFIKTEFTIWCTKTDFGSFIFEKNLHNQLMKTLEPIYTFFITPKRLLQFWIKSQSEHSSQKKVMLSILSSSINQIDEPSIQEFIQQIYLLNNVDKSMVEFLIQIIDSTSTKYPSIFEKNIHKLLSIILSPEIVSESDTLLAPFYSVVFSIKSKQYLLKALFNILENSNDIDVVIRTINKLIDSSYDSITGFGREFQERIIAVLAKSNKKATLYSLLSKYWIKSNHTLTGDDIIALNDVEKGDEFWHFLISIIDSLGVASFSQSGQEIILGFFRDYNYSKASLVFTSFLYDFILMTNFILKYIQAEFCVNGNQIPKLFNVMSLPLKHIEYLYKILVESDTNEVVADVHSKILTLFTKTLKIQFNDIGYHLNELIELSIFDKIKSSLPRVLSLVYEIIYKIEKDYEPKELDFLRHKSVKQNPNDSIRDVKVKFVDQIVTISISILVPGYILRQRVSMKMKHYKPKFMFKLGQTVIQNRSLLEYGYKNDSVINTEFESKNYFISDYFVPKTLPSIWLYQNHLTSKLLLILLDNSYSSFHSIIWRLLVFLPTDMGIIEEISDISSFVDSIIISRSEYDRAYRIQALMKNFEGLTHSSDCFIDSFRNLITFLISLDYPYKGESCALKFIHSKIDLLSEENCIILFGKLLKVLSCNQFKKHNVVYRLLDSLSRKFNQIISTLVKENPSYIDSIIKTANKENWESIKCFLVSLNCIKTVFSHSLDNLHGSFGSRYFVFYADLFSVTINFVIHDFKIQDILDQSLEILVKSNGSVLSAMSKVVLTIIQSDSHLTEASKPFLSTLIRKLFSIEGSDSIGDISKLIEFIYFNSVDSQQIVDNELHRLLNISIDKWNFKPFDQKKTIIGLSGLRNLGATCYMNSVLQQLFFIPDFIRGVFSSQLAFDGSNEFIQLLSEMFLSRRKFADTEALCSVWKGWAKKVINKREQQDAFEFFQLFIEQFPSNINSHFRGSFRNTIQGTDVAFDSFNIETFYALPLEIKGIANIEDAFNNFMQEEYFLGENQYYSDSLQKKINAKKFSRIDKIPNMLILQLKRFEYDLRTFNRIKINDKFEFPSVIDIKKMMYETKEEQLLYQIKGVILHSGTAQGGHYTSIVKNGDQWLYFNDTEVEIISESRYQELAFGNLNQHNDFDSSPSAYLLFFEKLHHNNSQTVCIDEKNDFVISFEEMIPIEIKERIRILNEEYSRLNTAFSSDFLRLMMISTNIELSLDFYFNIFVKSSNESLSGSFEACLKSLISQNVLKSYSFFEMNKEKIMSTLLFCQSENVQRSLNGIIIASCIGIPPEKSIVLFDFFVNFLDPFLQSWRQIPNVLYLLKSYVSISRDHCQITIDHTWDKLLYKFVSTIYDGTKSKIMISGIDLSHVFSYFKDVFRVSQTITFDAIICWNKLASESKLHIDSYRSLLGSTIIDYDGGINGLLQQYFQTKENDKFNLLADLLIEMISESDSEDNIANLSNIINSKANVEMSISLYVFMLHSCQKGNMMLQNVIINNYHYFLKPFISHTNLQFRKSAHMFFESFFPYYKIPKYLMVKNNKTNDENRVMTSISQSEFQAMEILYKMYYDHFVSFASHSSQEKYIFKKKRVGSEDDFIQLHALKAFIVCIQCRGILDHELTNLVYQLMEISMSFKITADYFLLNLLIIFSQKGLSPNFDFLMRVFCHLTTNYSKVNVGYIKNIWNTHYPLFMKLKSYELSKLIENELFIEFFDVLLMNSESSKAQTIFSFILMLKEQLGIIPKVKSIMSLVFPRDSNVSSFKTFSERMVDLSLYILPDLPMNSKILIMNYVIDQIIESIDDSSLIMKARSISKYLDILVDSFGDKPRISDLSKSFETIAKCISNQSYEEEEIIRLFSFIDQVFLNESENKDRFASLIDQNYIHSRIFYLYLKSNDFVEALLVMNDEIVNPNNLMEFYHTLLSLKTHMKKSICWSKPFFLEVFASSSLNFGYQSDFFEQCIQDLDFDETISLFSCTCIPLMEEGTLCSTEKMEALNKACLFFDVKKCFHESLLENFPIKDKEELISNDMVKQANMIFSIGNV